MFLILHWKGRLLLEWSIAPVDRGVDIRDAMTALGLNGLTGGNEIWAYRLTTDMPVPEQQALLRLRTQVVAGEKEAISLYQATQWLMMIGDRNNPLAAAIEGTCLFPQ